MKLQNNKRLRGFGLFSDSQYSQRHKNREWEEVDQFVEKFIREMDSRFLENDQNRYRGKLQYAIAGMLSCLMDLEGRISDNNREEMNDQVDSMFQYLSIILREKERYYSTYLDHIYWYYLEEEPDPKGNPSFEAERYLVIESHPYITLDTNDIENLHDIGKQHGKELRIEVRPGSHYFVDRTIYLRFIFDMKAVNQKEIRQIVKEKLY